MSGSCGIRSQCLSHQGLRVKGRDRGEHTTGLPEEAGKSVLDGHRSYGKPLLSLFSWSR